MASGVTRISDPAGARAGLRPLRIGAARVEGQAPRWRLTVDPTPAGRYADAQLDDYAGRPRRRFPWRPPLRLQLRARLGPEVHGTAGFGFWNNPFGPQSGVPTLPEALWFFYASPPNDMALVPGVPGHGWKAAMVHARRPVVVAACMVPLMMSMLWARVSGRADRAARWLQRLTGAYEQPLASDPAEWHRYTIEWDARMVVFHVDGAEVLRAADPPPGPLGCVIWIDTQYAVVTPRGRLGSGSLAVERPQWLEVEIEEMSHEGE